MFRFSKPTEVQCLLCGEKGEEISQTLGVCGGCIREDFDEALPYIQEAHQRARQEFGLPTEAPRSDTEVSCSKCINECALDPGDLSFCGLRRNDGGYVETLIDNSSALLHAYTDPLPTNCCANWFCPASKLDGKNLAVFFYGCGFDCLFCQNWTHKEVPTRAVSREELVGKALRSGVKCVCFFGGSPEPQLPFALKASELIRDRSKNTRRICWEWNGSGNAELVHRAAEISCETGGNIKFDLKAYDERLSLALSGVSNSKTLENFSLLANEFGNRGDAPVVCATTLLVPGYIDVKEVEAIAEFIASINRDIPYSLLAFHPDFMMRDLPTTTPAQAEACAEAARRYLNHVHLGNQHLLT